MNNWIYYGMQAYWIKKDWIVSGEKMFASY